MSEGRRRFEFAGYRIDEEKRLLFRGDVPVPLTSRVFDTLLVLVENAGRLLPKEELMRRVWGSAHVEEGNLTVNVSMLRKALAETPDDHRFIVTVPGRGYKFIAEAREIAEPSVTAPFSPTREPASPPLPVPDSGTRDELERTAPVPLPLAAANVPPARRRVFPLGKALAAGAVVAVAAAAYVTALAQRRETNRPAAEVAARRRSIAVLPFTSLDGRSDDRFLGLGMADAIITKLSGLRGLVVRPT
ncbi:MAG TPA: winged helix-turn-helix domain-containing protein, partial [Thermoanaerobaculia bacterium]|nr:winged helix-turn-helix domain-containing protein [Thermoanaerobaculia bacterium]